MTHSDSEWIPLVYIASNRSPDDNTTIPLVENKILGNSNNETQGNFVLRGYSVPYVIASKGRHHVTLCSEEDILDYPIEFRWLQTSSLTNRSIREDIVVLDNISISIQNSTHSASLFDEGFDDLNSPPYVLIKLMYFVLIICDLL